MNESPTTEPLVVPYHTPSADSLTKHDLGVLAVRLFGLYLLVHAFTYATYLPSLFAYQGSGQLQSMMLISGLIPCLGFGAGGLVLLRWAPSVSRRVFPEFAAGAALSATGRDLQAVAFSVVGVWLVATSLPDAARVVGSYYVHTLGATPLQQLPTIVAIVTQLVIGLLLFARGKALSALWHRLRYAGVTPPPPAAP